MRKGYLKKAVLGVVLAVALLLPSSALAFRTITTYSKVPLVNLGMAPGFAGGSGEVHYMPVNTTFIAEVTVSDLKPNHSYNIQVMGIDAAGKATAGTFALTTDGQGKGGSVVALGLPADAEPLPAYQVHVLVVDPSQTLEAPLPNPLGIPNPIPLLCYNPLGFRVGSP